MNIAIIGGGVAGMFAAIATSKLNSDKTEKAKEPSQVFILEKNEKLGKKMFISGKGRCNLTNACDKSEFFKNIVRNSKFLFSSFDQFSNADMRELVEKSGCPLKVERGNRVFPISNKSYDVIDALKKAVKEVNAKVRLNSEVKKIVRIANENKFEIILNNNEKLLADKVIVATGGLSYPSTGSTGDGYKFAKDCGINVIDQSPSLVPFNVKEVDDCRNMQGLTLKNIEIKISRNDAHKKVIYKDFGELLFTHFGVSGPVILSASCFVDNEEYLLSIDLKPALNEEKLEQRLIREFEANKNKKIKSIIESLLPNSMVDVFLGRLCKLLNYDISDLKVSDTNKEIRKSMVLLLKNFKFTMISKRDYNEAIITRGGVDVKEINPKTMESKKVKGLYFAGEVLDIDALTGGFNIQIASSTGYVAGKASVE